MSASIDLSFPMQSRYIFSLTLILAENYEISTNIMQLIMKYGQVLNDLLRSKGFLDTEQFPSPLLLHQLIPPYLSWIFPDPPVVVREKSNQNSLLR